MSPPRNEWKPDVVNGTEDRRGPLTPAPGEATEDAGAKVEEVPSRAAMTPLHGPGVLNAGRGSADRNERPVMSLEGWRCGCVCHRRLTPT